MSALRLSAVLALALIGCRRDDPNKDGSVDTSGYDLDEIDDSGDVVDLDGDGSPADEDCDDADARVHPGATEFCDGLDNDCDGTVDEPDAENASTWYGDADGDGYGVPGTSTLGCEMPEGYAATDDDCKDDDVAFHPGAPEEDCTDPNDYNCDGSTGFADEDGDGFVACEECDDAEVTVNPAATEVCNGIDDDCDGDIDSTAVDASTWYTDADADGYGDAATGVLSCEAPEGLIADGTDCDDADPAYNPGATESCDDPNDYNCDGSVGYADLDGDGYAACDECNDTDATVNPGGLEICNSIDDDCDGTIDEAGTSVWYADGDGDGYGDAGSTSTGCTAPAGFVADPNDCDDADAAVFPGAAEACTDTVDFNCDGSIGYSDADGDGWAACLECDDSAFFVNPDATEICNGVDDDCDGTTDEDGTDLWYADLDGDGYGDPAIDYVGCTPLAGYVADGSDCDDSDLRQYPGAPETCADAEDLNCDGSIGYSDADADGWAACLECDDTDAAVNPDQAEICNGIDDNCDGTVDEGGTTTWYADTDGDGYGDLGNSTTGCTAPSGYVADFTDCDDTDASFHPGASESCTDPLDYNCDGSVGYADDDGDGWAACEDCDDSDAAVSPDASEVCDGVDNNCDGTTDEGGTTSWYADADADGYGDASVVSVGCTAPSGYVAVDTDCDDTDAAFNPGASETCLDTVDYNCDGSIGYTDADGDGWAACEECDDGDASVSPDGVESCNLVDDDCDGTIDEGVGGYWYDDADGDGYGDVFTVTEACTAPVGTVADATDCDDTDAAAYPGATETCTDTRDLNCDGSIAYTDADGDGYAACEECDDGDAAVNPGAAEACNGIDDDCDGTVDEGGGSSTWYADADGDGYGDSGTTTTSCTAPTGYVANATDCDDADGSAHPGALEVCDGVDDDCDGTVDDGATSTYYADTDSDGYGDASATTDACAAPSGYVTISTDCADTDASVNPGATESCTDTVDLNCDGSIAYSDADADGWAACLECDDTDAGVNPAADEYCDGVDNDCDGTVDGSGALDVTSWYADDDGDGYGDAGVGTADCYAPSGYVADDTDCDDTDTTINPGAAEVCNLVDDDCDGNADDGVGVTYYADDDGDNYGDASSATTSCSLPSGYTVDDTDCDDTDATVNPGAAEVCNDTDDDCDTLVDEGVQTTWYGDIDGDGFGDASTTIDSCSAPSGYGSDATDCDDADAGIYPGAPETCDGVDEDCDGSVDESGGTTWYRDIDGDGYGTTGATVTSCTAPAGYVAAATDCDDGDAAVHPGATESCTTLVDLNCDGLAGGDDNDGDGYAACEECDDTDASVNPGAVEVCDGVDDDCDGLTDDASAADASDWYADIDGDLYGDASNGETACTASAGYVADDTDCDDSRAATNPGASEYCNSIDDDCDGSADEDALDMTTWYADADGDAYGVSTTTRRACTIPAGFASVSTDCNDANAAVNPGEAEVCNGIDDNCDGITDAGLTVTWYQDLDGDGYGNPDVSASSCTPPAGYVLDNTDCDDTDPMVYPGATEVDDLVDQDCDGWIDEDFVAAGDIVISEIHRRLGRGQPPRLLAGQWFEIYNTSTRTVALDNWYFYRYNSADLSDYFYVDPADTVILAPNSYAVFCYGDNYDATNNPGSSTLQCDYFWGDETQATTYQGTYHSNAFTFARNTDLFQVYVEGDTTTGRVVDDVAWTYSRSAGYWPREATQSMSLDDGYMDATLNDSLSYWCSTPASSAYIWYSVGRTTEYGTPGDANYDCP